MWVSPGRASGLMVADSVRKMCLLTLMALCTSSATIKVDTAS